MLNLLNEHVFFLNHMEEGAEEPRGMLGWQSRGETQAGVWGEGLVTSCLQALGYKSKREDSADRINVTRVGEEGPFRL